MKIIKTTILLTVLLLSINTNAKEVTIFGCLQPIPDKTISPDGTSTQKFTCFLVCTQVCMTITVPWLVADIGSHNGEIIPSQVIGITPYGMPTIFMDVSYKGTIVTSTVSGDLGIEHSFVGIEIN